MSAVLRHIPQACVDRVLWQQFRWKRVIEERVASFEFRKDVTYASLKASCVAGEQPRCSAIKALSPSAIIDSGNVDVVGDN